MAVLQQTVFTKLRSVLDLAYWVCRTHLKGLQYTSLIITVNLQVILYHFRYSVRTLQQYASISPALCYCSTFYFYMLQTTNYFYFDNELYFKWVSCSLAILSNLTICLLKYVYLLHLINYKYGYV